MNLFTEYYTSIVDLCQKYDPHISDLQIIDWLKAGMKISLYEKFQGVEFTIPQDVLLHAQRVELDNAVLDAKKREYPAPTSTSQNMQPSSSNAPKTWDEPLYYPSSSFSPSYPPPLMSTPYSISSPTNRSSSSRTIICYSCGQPGHISPNCLSSTRNTTTAAHPPIVCYSCGQPGHISPHCPYRPKD